MHGIPSMLYQAEDSDALHMCGLWISGPLTQRGATHLREKVETPETLQLVLPSSVTLPALRHQPSDIPSLGVNITAHIHDRHRSECEELL